MPFKCEKLASKNDSLRLFISKTPFYSDFELTKNKDIHEHNTRHCRDLHLPRAKTNKGKQRATYVKVLLHYITLKNY